MLGAESNDETDDTAEEDNPTCYEKFLTKLDATFRARKRLFG